MPFSADCGAANPNTAVIGMYYWNASGMPAECIGNSGRNAFVGPNCFNMDMAVQKGFHVFGENRMLTLRAEFFNVFNRSNIYNPISSYTLDGSNLNPDFGKIKAAHAPRQMQFGVRFTW